MRESSLLKAHQPCPDCGSTEEIWKMTPRMARLLIRIMKCILRIFTIPSALFTVGIISIFEMFVIIIINVEEYCNSDKRRPRYMSILPKESICMFKMLGLLNFEESKRR